MNHVFAFDGPDASGKTLITQLVVEELKLKYKPKGYEVWSFRMPGGTATGAKIREVLKNPEITISPLAERLLFAADAAEFFYYLLTRMAKSENGIYIVDRWVPVTGYMYSIPRGISPEELAYIRVPT